METTSPDAIEYENSNTDIIAKAILDRDHYMALARQSTTSVATARHYEEEAQAVATEFGIPIPELSDAEMFAKAIQEIDGHMGIARQGTFTVATARYYEKKAQAVAKEFGIPIPELSDAEMHAKAIQERDGQMEIARQGTFTVAAARYYEKEAQAVAKEFGTPVPELSDADIQAKAIQERDLCMNIAREGVYTVAGKRYYEEEAQAVAKKYGIPIPELSDA
jgi:hypothetical protein